jgi:dephospho-CoA kinase
MWALLPALQSILMASATALHTDPWGVAGLVLTRLRRGIPDPQEPSGAEDERKAESHESRIARAPGAVKADSWYQRQTVRIYGLTGGISSGKSSIAEMFRSLGAPVVDADKLARAVVMPGSEALAEIVDRFGAELLQADGSLDRQKLGAIVFADSEARQALNRITHPRIAAAGADAIAALAKAGETIAIYEAALIVENNLHKGMQGLIVVSLPEEMQVERLMRRDGLPRDQAEARIQSQLPLVDKVRVADYVIDNSGTLAETREQVVSLWETLADESRP